MFGWHHMGRGFMGGFRGGGGVRMILWLVVIVGLIVFLVKQFSNNSSHEQLNSNNLNSKSKDTPLEIAKERYAKGEIDKEEFQEIKNQLRE